MVMGCGNLLDTEKLAQLIGKKCARYPYFPLLIANMKFQSLQGHFSGDPFLIAFFNTTRFPISFSPFGIKCHINGPKNDTHSIPLYTEFSFSL